MIAVSYDTHAADSPGPSLYGVHFRHVLAITTVLVAGTIVLGVAARTTGSGLACDAQWPVCDGGFMNLLPEGRPSFWEWIHRVVAAVAGIAIIASALAAWVVDAIDRRVGVLVTAGMVLTPIQVWLGRETVLSYEIDILELHYWTAMVIFVLFVLALGMAWAHRLRARHAMIALGIGAITLPVQVLLSPLFVQQNTPTTLTIQTGVILTLLGCVVLSAMIGVWRFDERVTLAPVGLALALTAGVLVLSRESVMTVDATLDGLYVLSAGVLLVTLLAGIEIVRRDPAV